MHLLPYWSFDRRLPRWCHTNQKYEIVCGTLASTSRSSAIDLPGSTGWTTKVWQLSFKYSQHLFESFVTHSGEPFEVLFFPILNIFVSHAPIMAHLCKRSNEFLVFSPLKISFLMFIKPNWRLSSFISGWILDFLNTFLAVDFFYLLPRKREVNVQEWLCLLLKPLFLSISYMGNNISTWLSAIISDDSALTACHSGSIKAFS